jgi:hypothetical protein
VKVCSKDTSIPTKTNDTIADASSPAALDDKKDTGGGGLSADAKATIGGSVAGGVIALVGVAIAYMAYKHAKASENARKQSEAEKLEMELERVRTMSTYVGMSPVPRAMDSFSPHVGSISEEGGSRSKMELPKAALGPV